MMRAMLPALHGKRVVDLGCGMGAASRFLSEEGAGAVLGLDLSYTMLVRARAATSDPAITYAIADLEQLELSAHSFDLARRLNLKDGARVNGNYWVSTNLPACTRERSLPVAPR